MYTIDAHQHFWKYDQQRHDWIGDEMAAIRRDFMPQDLEIVLKNNRVAGSVAIQADQTEEETRFLLQLCDENSFIKGVVGWVDLQSPDIAERLSDLTQYEELRGFRHILQGEPQRDLFLQKPFLHGLSLLEKYGYAFDLLILPDQLQYLSALLKMLPHQRFVIDHLAKPFISTGEIEQWKNEIQMLAQFENLYCKISGMVTEATAGAWVQTDFVPYLDVVVNAFGTKRLMYGSDWPVCTAAADYGAVINIVRSYFDSFSDNEQRQVFAGTAIQFYQLNGVAG